MEIKKFLDEQGLSYLWKKLSLQDYPNNDTLVAVINAIDEGKMDKTTAIPLIEQAIAGQVPVVKNVDENGKPVEWEAQDFTKIPDTTSAKQYLVTNSSGEKVWTNLPVTETIRIDLTDATRIMPDVIQNYSALTPAEMIQKGRYLSAYNLVFYREIRDHVGEQKGVVVDLIKDRGYKAFKNENGDYCLRIYFDNYAPIIIDATKENPIYLDPEYVAPEPIIPETSSPNQYLTTNAEGEKVWEDKIDITPLQSAIDTLNGTGEGSVRDIVADSVATIVANAPEDFDTLKEVADWISNDTLGTADLLQRMTTAEEKIVALDVQADWNQTDESAKDFILNKPVPITDEEIDAICGGALTLDITENALIDATTGIVYRIYVEDGKLSMKQVNESTNTEQLVFVDTSTDIIYKVYVENGKLHMMEVE